MREQVTLSTGEIITIGLPTNKVQIDPFMALKRLKRARLKHRHLAEEEAMLVRRYYEILSSCPCSMSVLKNTDPDFYDQIMTLADLVHRVAPNHPTLSNPEHVRQDLMRRYYAPENMLWLVRPTPAATKRLNMNLIQQYRRYRIICWWIEQISFQSSAEK